jgi:hypothetical protein
MAKLKPKFLGPRFKLLGFHMSGPASHPYVLNKEMVMVKGRERKFLCGTDTAVGRGKVSTQPIFSHLWGTYMSFSFK